MAGGGAQMESTGAVPRWGLKHPEIAPTIVHNCIFSVSTSLSANCKWIQVTQSQRCGLTGALDGPRSRPQSEARRVEPWQSHW